MGMWEASEHLCKSSWREHVGKIVDQCFNFCQIQVATKIEAEEQSEERRRTKWRKEVILTIFAFWYELIIGIEESCLPTNISWMRWLEENRYIVFIDLFKSIKGLFGWSVWKSRIGKMKFPFPFLFSLPLFVIFLNLPQTFSHYQSIQQFSSKFLPLLYPINNLLPNFNSHQQQSTIASIISDISFKKSNSSM